MQQALSFGAAVLGSGAMQTTSDRRETQLRPLDGDMLTRQRKGKSHSKKPSRSRPRDTHLGDQERPSFSRHRWCSLCGPYCLCSFPGGPVWGGVAIGGKGMPGIAVLSDRHTGPDWSATRSPAPTSWSN